MTGGFDPMIRAFPDHIIGITREILKDRGIKTPQDGHAPEIVVRSPGSVVGGDKGTGNGSQMGRSEVVTPRTDSRG